MEQLKNDIVVGNKTAGDVLTSNRLEMTQESDTQCFLIGSFRIDIGEVKVSDLKLMRKLLPRNEYKLLKNRKCARLSRTRRKEQTQTIISINKRLKEENALLRQ